MNTEPLPEEQQPANRPDAGEPGSTGAGLDGRGLGSESGEPGPTVHSAAGPTPGRPTSANQSPPGEQVSTSRPVRTSPIVWGALFLAFCGFVLQRTLAPTSVDPSLWITATILGLGTLLLVVGIVVAFRGRNR